MSGTRRHPRPSSETAVLDLQALLHVAVSSGACDGELENVGGLPVPGPLELDAVPNLRVI